MAHEQEKVNRVTVRQSRNARTPWRGARGPEQHAGFWPTDIFRGRLSWKLVKKPVKSEGAARMSEMRRTAAREDAQALQPAIDGVGKPRLTVTVMLAAAIIAAVGMARDTRISPALAAHRGRGP